MPRRQYDGGAARSPAPLSPCGRRRGTFVATLYCRRDLWAKMLISGGLFLGVYFVVFAVFNLAFPGYVAAVWNLAALSGVLVAGVPLEELMFAFTFGLSWSSVYEHLAWKRSRPVVNTSPFPARIASEQ